MKKLFSLIALLTMFMGAKAQQQWEEIYTIDYSTYTGFPFYVMMYVPEFDNGCMTDFGSSYRYETQENLDGDGDGKWRDGESSVGTTTTQSGVVYQKVTGAGPYWHQYFLADVIPTEIGGSYKVKALVKASEDVTINVNMGWGWVDGEQVGASVTIPQSDEFVQVEWEYNDIGGTSCNLVAQPAVATATIEWKYVTVSHDVNAITSKPYAVLSPDNLTVTFYYDDQKSAQGGIDINNQLIENAGSPYGTATTAVFDTSFANYRPTSTAYWFVDCFSLTTIIGMENLKTDNVTDMGSMFGNCYSLTSLDVSNFKTDNVTKMYGMFASCSHLTSLDVSKFKTDNVQNMHHMFSDCSGLTSLDLSSFNTAKLAIMWGMFSDCSSLKTIFVGSGWNTGSVTNGSDMFTGCTSLVGGAGTTYDVNHTDYTYAHIDGGPDNPGYFSELSRKNLTAGDYFEWDGMGANAQKVGDTPYPNCQYILGESAGVPYGDPNVNAYAYADLSAYDRLEVTVTAGTPRILFNRDTEDGQWNATESESHMIESDQEGWSSKYFSSSDGVWTVDLKQIVADKGFAHLNAIKGANWGEVTITKMELIKDEESASPEPYAVLSNDSTTLTFYYDLNKESRGGMSINNSYLGDNTNSSYGTATTAVIDASFADYRPTSTAYWFQKCSSLTSITGMENLKTDSVTNMNNMFSSCSALTTLDVSNFNTAKVTDMSRMFYDCSALTTLDVSNFNTANVTSMWGMFNYCSSLTSLDVSGFNTAKATEMEAMFYGCKNLTSLDLSGFDTQNVTDMYDMFGRCSGLTNLDVSNFNTQNVTKMGYMFYGCSSLTTLDLSSFNTQNVTDMHGMLEGCSGLTSLDLSGFNTQNVTWMASMFLNCSGLTTLDLSGFSTEKVMDMSRMFLNCSGLTSLDLSGFSNEKVSDMSRMFYDCSALTTIYAGDGWSTANVENSEGMFTGCTNLVGGMGTVYDENHVDATYAHIDGGPSNPGYFTPKGGYVEAPSFAWSADELTMTSGTDGATIYYTLGEAEELVPAAYFESTVSGGIPEGFVVHYGDEDRVAPSTYSAGSRMMTYNEGGDFTRALYFREGYVLYGANAGYELPLRAGKTYNIQFNTMMWKENGKYMRFEVIDEADNVIYSKIIENEKNINGERDVVVSDSKKVLVNFTPEADGNYKLKWTAIDADGNQGVYCEVMLAKVTVNLVNYIIPVTQYTAPISVTSDVLIEAYAVKDGMARSMTTVLDYPYTAWMQLVTAIADAQSVVVSADGNDNVTAEQLNALNSQISVAQGMYIARTDSAAAINQMTTDLVTMTDIIRQLVNAENEPYAVLSNENTVLTFFYDKKKTERNGMDVGSYTSAGLRPWNSESSSITTVVFDASFADYRPTSTANWFFSMGSLTTITGIDNLKTNNVTSMLGMFQYCESLTSLDLSGFNTVNVESMVNMFYGCKNLTSIDMSNFNTASVTSMASMFYECQSLSSIDLGSFNTSSVMNMSEMFENCTAMTSLDVTGFNTANVTRMDAMFSGCAGLTVLDISSFNTAQVTKMTRMFGYCTNLKTIYVGSNWSATQASGNGNGMFVDCTSLVGGAGTVYNSSYIDWTYAHIDGGPDNPGYLTLALAMGDANGDGSINIADAVATVTNILGQPADGNFYKYAADMNNDSVIDIFDVTMIVNAVFDANKPAPALTRGGINVPAEAIRLTADANHIYMGIDQAQQYTAFQFDIDLPEGTSLVDVRLSGNTDHQLSFVKRGDNQYRVVSLSMSNEVFSPTNGHLIQLQVSNMAGEDNVKFSNMLFVTPAGNTVTGIDECLNATMATDDNIYDLNGRYVGNDRRQLSKGIYIINHKKVNIK